MNEMNQMSTKAQRFSWCLYDFANSGFPTVIVTAVYVIYFKSVVVGDGQIGYSDRLWGVANSIGAAIVFLLAPILGAVADISGKKRFFWVLFASLCILATAALSFTGPGTISFAMLAFILALVGFEGSCVFYNSFLPQLVPPREMDRLSGNAWALGYFGGLGCLLLALPLAMNPDYIQLVPLVVAVWFALFSIPSFLLIKDKKSSKFNSLHFKEGALKIVSTLREISKHKNLARFLLAYFFYNNAVITIIVFAVAFSRDTLLFSTAENIALIIVMNIIAAPGAFYFGKVAHRVGAKKTIIVTLFMWLVVVTGAQVSAWPGLLSVSGAKYCFWAVAVLASLCIGAIQATSRTFVGQLAPADQSGEFFGFMAFAGKGSAVVGPLVFGYVSEIFDSQRLAVLSIGLFFATGLVLMKNVLDPLNKVV